MRFPAFFDTNVLYGALLNDFILGLADRRLFRPLWSEDVLCELRKNLIKIGEDPELVEKRVGTMEKYFADALITDYAHRANRALQHVLGYLIYGRSSVLYPPKSTRSSVIALLGKSFLTSV